MKIVDIRTIPLFYRCDPPCELLKEPIRIDDDGMIRLPERPGLGIELDCAAIDRYRV